MSIDLKVFDLGLIDRSTGAERKQELHKFVDTLRQDGFVGIKVEDLESTINKAYEVAKNYFSLPIEEKNKEAAESLDPKGYHAMAREDLGNLENKSTGQLEYKESFLLSVGRLPRIHERECIEACHLHLHQMAKKILDLIEEYFEVPEKEKCSFEETSPYSATRLTHYPPMQSAPANSVWCAAHQDISPFALLPKATNQGLQLQRKDGQWLDINVPKNTVIVNTGKFFEVVTAGLIKPMNHRVVAKNPSDVRYSIIHFPSWRPDYYIKPWKNCLSLADPSSHKRLIEGKASSLFTLFLALTAMVKPSQEDIKKLAQEFPENDIIREKWPWAYEETK